MKKKFLLLIFLSLFTASAFSQTNLVAPGQQSFFFSAGVNFVQYLNQQTNLDTGGPKLAPSIYWMGQFLGQPAFFGILSGSAPTIGSRQTAALRLLLPMDLDIRFEPQIKIDTNWYLTLSADLLTTTIPQKVVISTSGIVYTPGFLGLTAGTWGQWFISNSILDHIATGLRVRQTSDLWNTDAMSNIFPTGTIPWNNTNYDFSAWLEFGLPSSTALKIQFYSYLSGPLRNYAYNGTNGSGPKDFLNSGVLSIQISQLFNLGGTKPTPSPTPDNAPATGSTPGSETAKPTESPTPEPFHIPSIYQFKYEVETFIQNVAVLKQHPELQGSEGIMSLERPVVLNSEKIESMYKQIPSDDPNRAEFEKLYQKYLKAKKEAASGANK